MPPLDEGTFLWMPTTMPHASLGEVLEVMQYQDQAIAAVPEVDLVVGKLGRAESALDPAPVSMIETVINYKPEYVTRRSRPAAALPLRPPGPANSCATSAAS
jgi:copper/silver efflux system protein